MNVSTNDQQIQKVDKAEQKSNPHHHIDRKTQKSDAADRISALKEQFQAEKTDPNLKDSANPSFDLQEAQQDLRFFQQGKIRQIFSDWMPEDGVVSFHPFQMFASTMALGLVFVARVMKHLELPTFDAATLSLTGISSGTYLGFKFPDTRPNK